MIFSFKPLRCACLAVALLAPVGAALSSDAINLLTGGTSGVYHPMGVALSKIYEDKIPGVRTQVLATKASVENLTLLEQGKGEIAFSLGDSIASAWKGDAEAGFPQPLRKLRGIAAIYPNYIQIVASKESGIKSLADLKGKRLSVGAAKSGTELNARIILAAAGMGYKDLGKVEYLPFNESVDLMKKRELDATLQSAGLGVASLRDLAAAMEVVMVEVPPRVVDQAGLPFIQAAIPPNTYPGQSDVVSAAAVMNYLVTHDGVPEARVYEMTKQLFENLPALSAAHSAGRAIRLQKAVDGMSIPMHPGAARYFTEKGIKVPEVK